MALNTKSELNKVNKETLTACETMHLIIYNMSDPKKTLCEQKIPFSVLAIIGNVVHHI